MGVGRVADRVGHVLGIGVPAIDGYTRRVDLPDVDIDEFLRGDAKKRRDILSDLLRLRIYESMRKQASAKGRDAKTQVEFLEKELATRFADVTTERRRVLPEQAVELIAQREGLEGNGIQIRA